MASCDPAALARDLKIFMGTGYRLAALSALDMFPHTHHFETIAVLVRDRYQRDAVVTGLAQQGIEGRPVGWVCTRLHPEDRMGEVYIVVVDPDYQRRGIGRALMNHSMERARAAGMAMVMVETGGDLGHAPARATYEGLGFQRWPVARYFKDLADGD